MNSGFRGTFVLSWSQTELDGQRAAPPHMLRNGSTWSWHGELVQVDGASEPLRLGHAIREGADRRPAARIVQRLVGAAAPNPQDAQISGPEHDHIHSGFIVTDGIRKYKIAVEGLGRGMAPVLLFPDAIPPRDTEMWVVHTTLPDRHFVPDPPHQAGVICFTPGTQIATPDGPRLVQDLREGDRVLTKDSGTEEIQWIGSRRMSGARLFAMPQLRPIRIRAEAFGLDRPDTELLVSPDHRVLIKGKVARALFNEPEVLVCARDLLNNSTVSTDLAIREVTYVHLLLPQHHILWANGVETESFHPAGTSLDMLAANDRDRLLALDPRLEDEPQAYGSFARRNLSPPEAAILTHEAA